MSDLLEYNYGVLKQNYEQVLAERHAALQEIAQLRADLARYQPGSKKNSFRGIGQTRDGRSSPDSGRSGGFRHVG